VLLAECRRLVQRQIGKIGPVELQTELVTLNVFQIQGEAGASVMPAFG